jgi:nucleotide-binding universal stress UspA family protein
MYTNILIPTDGSELAEKAVQHGIALAKRIGAKATVLTVLTPFHTFTIDTQMIEDTPAQYKVRIKGARRENPWRCRPRSASSRHRMRNGPG